MRPSRLRELPRVRILAVLLLFAFVQVLWAVPPIAFPAKLRGYTNADVIRLTAKIDQLIAERWVAEGVQPAAPADDAEFMRRVYLDVAGKIPPVGELRAFLDDRSAEKRQRLVERLLESPAYVNHFGNVWRATWLPETNANFRLRYFTPYFEAWLRKRLHENAGYDTMVRDLLDSRRAVQGQAAGRFNGVEPYNVYYQANEGKPENLAASSSRLFLGMKLECAQCHDHPFTHWKREQFWSYAAFFANAQANAESGFTGALQRAFAKKGLTIPGTDQVVQARFLDDKEPDWQGRTGGGVLADWMTAADNPYFARAAVNRLWAHFFGLGIVEPVDDLGGQDPPSHPELLDELGRQLAVRGYDLKFLIRAITASRAYQLTSAGPASNPEQQRLFARMELKGLSPEQLFDSLAQATGYREPTTGEDTRFAFYYANTPRAEFLAKFANRSDKRTESQTSILQALSLMNGKIASDVTSLERSETLAAVADAPFMNDAQRIETLYLAALSRKPRPEETVRLVSYVRTGGPGKDSKKALADVLWALLNSSEFKLNR